MAKYNQDLPGNGMNISIKLTDLEGNRVENDIFEQAVAGILKHQLNYLCFYAPNINSYKRFYEDEIISGWNHVGSNADLKCLNILKEKNSEKINYTIPGSDSNPYLVLLGLIESVKSGINDKLRIEAIEKESKDLSLPTSLNKARKLFEKSGHAKKSLGDEFHYHYNAIFSYECESFNNQISVWELGRYLYSV